MNTADCVKCITTLVKTLKIVKCVKKVEMCVIIGVIILMSLGVISDNRKAIFKTVKLLKKKVM
ncbi:MAG: hypothetical protein ACI4RU_08250 [Acutalibacteraceae bacterium]